MLKMQSMTWVRDAWELRFSIHEGVYDFDGYPVRISHLAFTEDPEVQAALSTVAEELLLRHLRSGAVPPHSIVLNWARVRHWCENASPAIVAGCRQIDRSHLSAVSGALSNHF